MRAYHIYYYAPPDTPQLDDVWIAESSVEAIKKFIICYKGKYNVAFAKPI